jgi:hypothetical protein
VPRRSSACEASTPRNDAPGPANSAREERVTGEDGAVEVGRAGKAAAAEIGAGRELRRFVAGRERGIGVRAESSVGQRAFAKLGLAPEPRANEPDRLFRGAAREAGAVAELRTIKAGYCSKRGAVEPRGAEKSHLGEFGGVAG